MSDELTYFVMRSGCEVPHKHGELSEIVSRLILAGLALHADKDTGTLYVSYRGLARELDINHNTTFLAYKLYEQHGVLVRTGKRKGVGGTTEYRLNFDHLTPQNEFYKPPTDPNTQATSPQTSSPASSPASDPASSPASDPPTDLSTQARNRNGNGNGNTTTDSENVEALFEQALALELQYRPTQVPLDKLKASKRQTYEQACTEVLTQYPTAQPASCPDRDLALVVCHKMNPTLPALKVSEATYTALSKQYNSKPATTATEPPLTPEQIRKLIQDSPLRQNLRKPPQPN
jgi:hypothetical protein